VSRAAERVRIKRWARSAVAGGKSSGAANRTNRGVNTPPLTIALCAATAGMLAAKVSSQAPETASWVVA